MIIWCAYCQRFQGEVPPFERREVSHGLCRRCEPSAFEWTSEQEERIAYLADLNQRFWRAGRSRSAPDMETLAIEGFGADIRPIDMLFGFAGPLLATIGQRWAANILTACEEHQFTDACEALVNLIERHVSSASAPSAQAGGPTILLAAVEGNEHALGCRFAALGFESMGIRATVLEGGGTPQAIVDAALALGSSAVGLSISLSSQIPALRRLLDLFAGEPAFNAPILVGGAAVNSEMVLSSAAPGARLVSRPAFNESDAYSFAPV
ncbi:MAG: cobalamin B12-binding domain-containing protein, partial [Gemmatimonadales bacterium]|nr:cobalamin B12-binding domain-containing protein [Gemmatimonadales bacterium]